MTKMDIWPTVHAERAALVADLDTLPEDRWTTASLCDPWSVRDVLAHMSATASITPTRFFTKLVGSGFSLTRLQAKDLEAARGKSAADTLAGFTSITTSTKHPPGPTDTMLGETIIHAQDVRIPLGIAHDYPTEAVVQVANFYKGSNLVIGTKRRIAGLHLQATDTDWSHGSGQLVSGPIIVLLMAMTGRKTAAEGLTGDGVPTLQQRP